MYVDPNFKTKKAFKEAVEAGKAVAFFQPGGIFAAPKFLEEGGSGKVYVEGPHYPEAHTWYAEVTIENGKVVKIK